MPSSTAEPRDTAPNSPRRGTTPDGILHDSPVAPEAGQEDVVVLEGPSTVPDAVIMADGAETEVLPRDDAVVHTEVVV